MFGDIIDRNPFSDPEIPLRIEYPSSGFFTTNHLKDRTSAAEITAAAMKACAELLDAKAPGPGTAILDSLSIMGNVFANYASASKYLVILSDGIEESKRLTFTKAALTQKSISQLIASDRREHRLPDLAGVQVYFAGAGATSISSTGGHRAWQVKNFWLRYLRAAGAALPSPRYGPILIRFP